MAKLDGFREYQEPAEERNDPIMMEENLLEKSLRILPRLEPGEQLTFSFLYYNKNIDDTTPLRKLVETLRQEGVNIGKGNAQYGFRMPVPDPKEPNYGIKRELVIFRRR